MKNPIRILCSSIVAPVRPLMAAGGLCTAAVLLSVWAGGSRGRDTAEETTGGVEPGGGKKSSAHPNSRSRGADPARALAQAFTLGDRSERDNLVRDLLSRWAAQEAEAALEWASTLEDSDTRHSARATVFLTLAEKDPRQAVTLALAHGTDQEDDRGLLECLTMQWCEKESEAALNWASEQPPGEWRECLLSRASFVLSKSDPAAAARVVAGLEPGAVQDEAAMAVLHQWALQDSSAALKWAEQFSEPTLRERALAEISNLRDLTTSIQEVR